MDRKLVGWIAIAVVGQACVVQTPQGQESTMPPPQPYVAQSPPPQPVAAQPVQVVTAQPVMQPQPTAYGVMQPQPTPYLAPQPVAQPVAVQVQPYPQTGSNFGTVALTTGFLPDPHVVQGRSGGALQARNWNSSCVGWVSQTPDHIFVAQSPISSLRIMAASDQDITLVVQRPDGGYLCNDDSEGTNPVVASYFQPGTYRVWVGSYSQGTTAPYRLGFTEISSVTAASLGGGGAVSTGNSYATGYGGIGISGTSSNFGTVRLAPGFMPDPAVTNGTSGGSIQASQVSSNCNGWIASEPDHIFVAQTYFDDLRILVRSSSDTTLVVQTPSGQWLCNDDSEGTNPVVGGSFQQGTYRIWVGSYRQGENAAYRIGFTELGSVSTSSL